MTYNTIKSERTTKRPFPCEKALKNSIVVTIGLFCNEISLTKVLKPKFGWQKFWNRNFGSKTFGNEIWVPKLLETKFGFQNFCQPNFVAKKAYGCYNGVLLACIWKLSPLYWILNTGVGLSTLWFHLEDTVLLISTLLLFDPILFPKYEVCLLIGSIHSAKEACLLYGLCCFVWILDHAHLFTGGMLFNWNSMLSTHTDFGVMSSNWIVST